MTMFVSVRPSLAVVPADRTTMREGAVTHDGDPRIGSVLHGTYRVVRRIGGGGMGTVYEAEHTRLQQRFALKFLDASLTRDTEAYARFRQEAEIAASLAHDSIVQVFDFNVASDDTPYMVLEFVEGVTLGEWMHGRRVPALDVLRVFQPLCDALAAAHAAGIVHRDLKPNNVMVHGEKSDLTVKLFDFGISKVAHVDAMTRANVLMGTPHYMSPEQASGNAATVDASTDVFALGALLYEMLSGRPAFDQTTTAAVLHAIVYEAPPALAELCPDLPPALAAVVEKCLAKSPTDRFPDTRTLFVAMRAAVRGRPRPAAEIVDDEPHERTSAVPWAIGWGVSVLLAAVGSGLAVGHAPAPPAEIVTARPHAAATPSHPQDHAAEPAWRHELATPGAFVLESSSQLYRADARGLSYWSDPDAETTMRPLPSTSPATSLGRAREGDIIVGQADGTVSRWDRELRDPPWHQKIGASPVHAITASAGYLAIASGTDVQLVHAESGKPLKKFSASTPAVSLLFMREPNAWLVIVRSDTVEFVDADKRKSLGSLPLAGRAARAAIAAEPLDDPAEIEIDFVQGDWTLRRKYRMHVGRKGQTPRLEPSGQKRI
jgi:tRNA A-37 threonylcarbamoyl transferase component Bud32